MTKIQEPIGTDWITKFLPRLPFIRLVKKKVNVFTPHSTGWCPCLYSRVYYVGRLSLTDTGMSFLDALDDHGMYRCRDYVIS